MRRHRRPTDPAWFGRRPTGVAWARYGTPTQGMLRREAGGFHFSRRPVIGWEEPARIVAGEWIAANLPSDRIFYRSNSLENPLMAVRAGLGIALLPCHLADPDDGPRRISGVLTDLASESWIVTHQDLKNTARIRAFLSVIGDAIIAARRGLPAVEMAIVSQLRNEGLLLCSAQSWSSFP